ncbi:hypothetical protein PVK06_006070 [Gossypium arboreum]|uniref:Retrotransposon gag domain-containing protein n=1 Tax=Gossypium arboreum TaxID=29729 RepID=A0ABR0QWA6_GOSAR|nr:hypothetical protein PVK06_006070 [Gossypium arboreum]
MTQTIRQLAEVPTEQPPLCIAYPTMDADFELKSVSRAAELRREILRIRQKDAESLYDYWEQFKKLCASCPQHEKAKAARLCGICATPEHTTDTCPSLNDDTMAHLDIVGNFPRPPQRRYDLYANTYNPGWRDHPNLSYGANPRFNQSNQNRFPQQARDSNAIRQIPQYAKFLKELCTNKRKLTGNEKVSVGENVSAVVQQKMPAKCKDRDFYVINMEEDNTTGSSDLLLGRPFLITASTKIDVRSKTLKMKFDREIVKFNVYDAISHPSKILSVNRVDIIDSLVDETSESIY